MVDRDSHIIRAALHNKYLLVKYRNESTNGISSCDLIIIININHVKYTIYDIFTFRHSP